MHNLKSTFDRIKPIVKESLANFIDSNGNINKIGAKPKFSDVDLIALSLVAESLSINSENLLFAKLRSEYQEDFPLLIDRSQFNRRRKHLAKFINIVRETLVQKLLPAEDTFILDSMPVEICKFTRAKRIKICKESIETAPEYGYCAAQNTHYFGYKFHGVCSLNGVITCFDLLKPIMRSNQKNYRRQPALFRKVRKRIETLFSQLVDQFVIRINYTKIFVGLATRILSKVTAFTLLQFLNSINNKPLNHIKHALA